MKLLNRETISGVAFFYIRMTHEELTFLKNCLHDILLKSKQIKEDNPNKLIWYKAIFSKISNCLESKNLNIERLTTTKIAKEYLDNEIVFVIKLTSGEHDLLVHCISELKSEVRNRPLYSKLLFYKKSLCNDVENLSDYFQKLFYFGVEPSSWKPQMTKTELIEYLHSAYPELTINTTYIRGYSEEDILKLERLYNIKIQRQLYDFLTHMGRCSGGLFGDYPLEFYSKIDSSKDRLIFQSECRKNLKDLVEIQGERMVKQKPFFISMENEGIYKYFLVTESYVPDLVYYLDTNYNAIVNTGLLLNEYLRKLVDTTVRNYAIKPPFDQEGSLL
ncbi:hypothetical protein [Xenorhabdus bovienii]|uniref:hypothetical protein n=1 Tax=Xenorhabdus bovienii TaxID=40576 RepID=UPI0023B20C6C|nr:hypothetical protein [Xenorhabdus bovienii]